jgi:integrase
LIEADFSVWLRCGLIWLRLLKQRLAEAGSGRSVGPELDRTTFEDLQRILLDDYKANGRRSVERAEDALNRLATFFAGRRAREIGSDRLTAYQAHRQQEGAASSTINYEQAILRRAFRLTIRVGKVAVKPEFAMLHVNNARTGFFEPGQFQAVLDELPDYLKPVFQVVYVTGWRALSELLTRQWRHVDFDAGWFRLDPGETKNSEGRQFPLTPELRRVLEEQRERTRALEKVTGQIIPWVFHRNGARIKNYYGAWNKACEAVELPDSLVHDFRRTAVRNHERSGVPRSAAMKMTGHKTESVYRRYAIVDEGMMKEAAAKLALLHAGENRHYAMTPRQVERLVKATEAKRPSSAQVRRAASN